MYTTLIDPKTLHAHINDPNWVIIDCSFDVLRKEQGFMDYQESHLPNAIYAHLDNDLSAPKTPSSGRHPLPDIAAISAKLSAWGVDENVQVVAYDENSGGYAARLWWLLRWLGHEKVAVLNGGLQTWQDEGYDLVEAPGQPTPRQFNPKPNDAMWVDLATVAQVLEQGGLVLDARGADRFAGQNETLDPIAGHIPGTRNAPFTENVISSAQPQFRATELLQQRFKTLCGDTPVEQVIHMCGSGVTACHNVLAMENIGMCGSKLYVGSWSEWITDPNRPIATGA